ncbi:MAG: class I SAM-dependent methyltransferase [Proteobacteria bacterium]|nr:class I SAM-dependent methyltransferase [Pseudomonadota bacterium]
MKKTDPCILCDTIEFKTIHQKNQYQYFRCLNCKLVSLYPRPTLQMLKEYYRDYLPGNSEDIRKWGAMIRPVVTKSADLINFRLRTGGKKMLDIGCGYGFLLKEMKARGWDVEGLEVSQTGREYALRNWNVPVYSEPLENLELPASTFDVVTLLYVIEHIFNPLSLLSEINRVLKPEGLILIRWPHTTPVVKILGPLSKKLDLYHTPYHLYDFSPKTIEKMLFLTGFKSVETIISGHTIPSGRLGRWSSTIFGKLSDFLFYFSKGKILLPGISKITLAFK